MAMLASVPKESWYADSGCSEHMTKLREVFHTSQRRPIEGIGGTLVYIKGINNVVIKIFIDGQEEILVLKNVFHVPSLGRNLFSISTTSK